VTVQLRTSAMKLLTSMIAGGTLEELRGRWSSWYLTADGRRRRAFSPDAEKLVDAGFIGPMNSVGFEGGYGAHYLCFNYTVTDAGRAFVAANHAPQEST
jgi:hypothetical protein